MPNHASMTGAELHECKQISSAVTADAGKVVTPSDVTAGTGTLRKLLVTELDTDVAASGNEGAVVVQSAVDNEPEIRFLTPDDVEDYKTSVQATFADIGTLDTQYAVAPHAVDFIRIHCVLYGAITGTDETVTVTVGSADPETLTVPVSGSGAGVVTSGTLTALSASQVAGSRVTIETAGDSTGATQAVVVVSLEGQT